MLTELTRLIASVPAGGRIDCHNFSITVDIVAQALLDAQTRRGRAPPGDADAGGGGVRAQAHGVAISHRCE